MRRIEDDQRAIRQYLEALAGLENGSRAFAAFILDHGQTFVSAPLDDGIEQGPPRGCFRNSQKVLFDRRHRNDGLTYVEGYACSGSLSFSFPVHHAWLVDREGIVVDPTWDDPEHSAYFGVPFDTDYVRTTVRAAKVPCSMIDNFHDRWALLRTPELVSTAVMDFKFGAGLGPRP